MTELGIIPVGGELPPMEPTIGTAAAPVRGELSAGRRGDSPKRTPGKRADAVRRRFGMLYAFLDGAVPGLTRAELAAWVLLYRHAKPDGTVKASVLDLARRAGCKERAMRYGLKRLQMRGLLARLKRGTLVGGPSIWRLQAPDAPVPYRQRTAG